MSPPLKLSLLIFSIMSYEVIFEYPSPPRPDDTVMVTTARERILARTGLPCNIFLKGTLYLVTAAEMLAIIGAPLHGLDQSFRDALGPAEASTLSPTFVLGAFLVITGGYIRHRSYRALGPLFTFEQCISKDHKLVTIGPYGVVRHPSYSALLVNFLGTCVMYGGRGSYLRTSGVLLLPWVRLVTAIWILLVLASVTVVFFRSTDEDRILSERFGKEWEEWARRVPYKLIPFVY